MTDQKVLHPARYSKNILRQLQEIIDAEWSSWLLRAHDEDDFRILDPFAGTGRIHELADAEHQIVTIGNEIEAEWAHMHPYTFQGDAMHLPWCVWSFDMVVTSPTYGNRYSDHHNPQDISVRRSYTFDIRNTTGDMDRQLNPNNTGLYGFTTPKYKNLHIAAWHEVWRVLKPGGAFVLNISDFISHKKVVNVCRWHIDILTGMGFNVEREIEVPTARLRYGRNWESRVAFEKIYVLRRP